MRRIAQLVACVALATLAWGAAGCGDDEPMPAPTPTTGGYEVGQVVEHTEVALVTGSAAGGEVSSTATVLDGPDALADFVAAFDRSTLGDDVAAAVERADPGPGEAVVAAVVDLGCDPPEEVTVVRVPGGVRVSRADKADPDLACYVAMTTVAVLTVPAAAADPA